MLGLVLAKGSPLDAFNTLRYPFEWVLGAIYPFLNNVGPLRFVGAYGLSIIILTVLIKTLLFPLFQTQLKLTKKAQTEQRAVAPQMAELRKKYKSDPTRLNTEMMALYKEHGINPLGQMAGCLPVLAQFPVLIGLYRAIADKGFYQHLVHDSHFLWVNNLAASAHTNQPITFILPVLAGMTTFIQSKMFTPAPDPNADPSAQQMAQVTKSMSLLMPLMIIYFSFLPSVAQGLVLYWIVSNLFSIGQQYYVNGWGQLSIPLLGIGAKPVEPPVGNDKGATGGTNAKARSAAATKAGKALVGQPAGGARRGRRR
ncbi:MAG: YidC/Oxa1 family membrane protein insertase [Candidatus Dormibacteria bacterium]